MSLFLTVIQCQQFGDLTAKKTNILFIVEKIKRCIKMYCTSLMEHVKKTIDFEKKILLLLTKEKLKSHQDRKV